MARLEYSDEDGCFMGHLMGISDVVGFHADTVKELREAFEEAVDDYLATCEKIGRAAQKPYSGKLLLRIAPDLHARAAGKSVNQWAAEALDRAVDQR